MCYWGLVEIEYPWDNKKTFGESYPSWTISYQNHKVIRSGMYVHSNLLLDWRGTSRMAWTGPELHEQVVWTPNPYITVILVPVSEPKVCSHRASLYLAGWRKREKGQVSFTDSLTQHVLRTKSGSFHISALFRTALKTAGRRNPPSRQNFR